jgi:hypothetical protein
MSQAETQMIDRKLYVCPRVATCPFKDCAYHRVYRRANASGWWNERTCPKEGLPLDPFVVVVEEQPA